ncbi:lipase family protein [Nocardia pseudobrasiliensis]|uniref:Triacylglycerol lipase n=1 Tax=Nocardia pseudobrasiliensis TaxID=45979 RepID=A0A370HY81_9NOCA|nr:lipase family protein [Nocardia pseudobrasiliensis]RDI62871.1 triacylglycerol lipase [Nocardia pseudobrasiliensis]
MSVTVSSRRRLLPSLVGVLATGLLITASANTALGEPTSDGDAPAVEVQPARPFPLPPSPPEFDPEFYEPPADVVAAKQPGEIIAARQVNLALYSTVPFNIDSWQLSYRSTDTRGEPIAAVTTVMKPRGDNGGKPRNLLSYQFPVDSGARYCSPSYVLQQGSIPGNVTGQFDVPFEFLVGPITALGAGWAVAIPDHDGPNTAFAAGPLEGRITLDGIRAAENFEPMGLPGRDTEVGMAGYSGGAIATTHAAELHAAYAPELKIVGAASGGGQADLRATVLNASGNLGSGLILGGLFGVAREYPELARYLDEHLTPAGKALRVPHRSLCLFAAGMLPFMNLESLFDIPNPLDDPVAKSVFNKVSLGHSAPDIPTLLYQTKNDEFAPEPPMKRLVEENYCRDPEVRLQYVRDSLSEHLILQTLAAPRVLLWLEDRFSGVAMKRGCEIREETSMAMEPDTWPVWLKGAGNVLAGVLQQRIGHPDTAYPIRPRASIGAR